MWWSLLLVLLASGGAFAAPAPSGAEHKEWLHSDERTREIMAGERKVAIVAEGCVDNMAASATNFLSALSLDIDDVRAGIDIAWLLYAGTLVFLMQLGFAQYEAGRIRPKNIISTYMKNIIDFGIHFGTHFGHPFWGQFG